MLLPPFAVVVSALLAAVPCTCSTALPSVDEGQSSDESNDKDLVYMGISMIEHYALCSQYECADPEHREYHNIASGQWHALERSQLLSKIPGNVAAEVSLLIARLRMLHAETRKAMGYVFNILLVFVDSCHVMSAIDSTFIEAITTDQKHIFDNLVNMSVLIMTCLMKSTSLLRDNNTDLIEKAIFHEMESLHEQLRNGKVPLDMSDVKIRIINSQKTVQKWAAINSKQSKSDFEHWKYTTSQLKDWSDVSSARDIVALHRRLRAHRLHTITEFEGRIATVEMFLLSRTVLKYELCCGIVLQGYIERFDETLPQSIANLNSKPYSPAAVVANESLAYSALINRLDQICSVILDANARITEVLVEASRSFNENHRGNRRSQFQRMLQFSMKSRAPERT